jgi:alkanesulfonate monooxygenase SsuD/methylene tetrahydromethanopterin reductase-like flavin-dependent oxidoreductase (luciferase family)
MKVRFGFACRGQAELPLDGFPRLVDHLERLGFDSIWLPELMLNGPFDPLVALAHAAARTTRLKLGAYLIVPGRNPVRLARALANLDRLSGGRLLLIMVLGQPDAAEVMAQHVSKAERGALLEEVTPFYGACGVGKSSSTTARAIGCVTLASPRRPCKCRSRCGWAGRHRRRCVGQDAWATGGAPASSRPPKPRRNACASRPRRRRLGAPSTRSTSASTSPTAEAPCRR